jgi:hypothetical protein
MATSDAKVHAAQRSAEDLEKPRGVAGKVLHQAVFVA